MASPASVPPTTTTLPSLCTVAPPTTTPSSGIVTSCRPSPANEVSSWPGVVSRSTTNLPPSRPATMTLPPGWAATASGRNGSVTAPPVPKESLRAPSVV